METLRLAASLPILCASPFDQRFSNSSRTITSTLMQPYEALFKIKSSNSPNGIFFSLNPQRPQDRVQSQSSPTNQPSTLRALPPQSLQTPATGSNGWGNSIRCVSKLRRKFVKSAGGSGRQYIGQLPCHSNLLNFEALIQFNLNQRFIFAKS